MERKPYNGAYQEVLKRYGLAGESRLELYLIEYEAGEYICHQEEELSYVLLVLKGDAKVFCNLENGKRLLLSFYTAGGVIGDLEFMLATTQADSSVQAITKFLCIGIPTQPNRASLSENSVFLFQMGKNLAHKIKRSAKNSAHNILYPLEVRLCSYIDTACENDVFDEKLTEVAEALGTSYRHLLRVLNELLVKNILQKKQHKYVIIDRAGLKELSQDFYKPVEGSWQEHNI